MTAGPWAEARRELDGWADRGLTARFWVRDDDACAVTEPLERLHALAVKHDISIGLALVPGKLETSLVDDLGRGGSRFRPMCHGWKHVDHGPAGRPAEFGRDRPLPRLIADAQAARAVFARHFAAVPPVFVPPFNRIAPVFTRALPELGFAAVSAVPGAIDRHLVRLRARFAASCLIDRVPAFGTPRIDVHVDPIDWRAGTALPIAVIADGLARQLRGRRGLRDGGPIGVLTHHLVHDAAIWRVCDELIGVLRAHRAVEFVDVATWSRGLPQRQAVAAPAA